MGSRGGAINVVSSRGFIVVKKCSFNGNIARSDGGDIFLWKMIDVTLTYCTFSNSESGRDGGSIYIESEGNTVVSNCTFSKNIATGMGGGVFLKSSILRGRKPKLSAIFNNCTFFGNEGEKGGGGIAWGETAWTTHIKSCKFHMNSAKAGGGGLMVRTLESKPGSKTFVHHSLFENNIALIGGGIYVTREKTWNNKNHKSNTSSQSVSIDSCEFRNNSASSTGQSVYSSINAELANILVDTSERYVAPHLSLDVGDIRLQNVTMKLHRDPQYRLPSKSRGVELKSKDIILSNGLTVTCPINFKMDKVKLISEQIKMEDLTRWVDNNRIIGTKYKFFGVDCVACPYASYSLGSGRLYLPELSTEVPPANNAAVQTVKCEPCPTGKIPL